MVIVGACVSATVLVNVNVCDSVFVVRKVEGAAKLENALDPTSGASSTNNAVLCQVFVASTRHKMRVALRASIYDKETWRMSPHSASIRPPASPT